jgi:hypothetical protein
MDRNTWAAFSRLDLSTQDPIQAPKMMTDTLLKAFQNQFLFE